VSAADRDSAEESKNKDGVSSMA